MSFEKRFKITVCDTETDTKDCFETNKFRLKTDFMTFKDTFYKKSGGNAKMKIKSSVTNWTQYKKEIENACQKHRELINTKFMKFLAGSNPNYGNEWIYVFWVNPHSKKLEQYDVGNINEAQELIDFYNFSKNNTKIVIRATGEDVSNQITFN